MIRFLCPVVGFFVSVYLARVFLHIEGPGPFGFFAIIGCLLGMGVTKLIDKKSANDRARRAKRAEAERKDRQGKMTKSDDPYKAFLEDQLRFEKREKRWLEIEMERKPFHVSADSYTRLARIDERISFLERVLFSGSVDDYEYCIREYGYLMGADPAVQAVRARLAEAQREAEEAKRAEAARKAEEAKRAEAARKAEEAKRAEAARKAEEAKRAEAARKTEEVQREVARKAGETQFDDSGLLEGDARKAKESKRATAARKAKEDKPAEAIKKSDSPKRATTARKAKEAKPAESTKQTDSTKRAEAEIEPRHSSTSRNSAPIRLVMTKYGKLIPAEEAEREEAVRKLEEAKQLEAARKEEEERRATIYSLQLCVESWYSHPYEGIKHKWFVDYYPYNKYRDSATPSMQADWKLVWNFKNDRNISPAVYQRTLDYVVKMTVDTLNSTFGPRTKYLTLVCLSASTAERTKQRFEEFSRRVCSALGMRNGYDYIRVVGDSTAKHEGGSGRPQKQYDSNFFNGSYIILFDDVRTSGGSLVKEKNTLETLGAKVIAAITIAQTTG